MYIMHQLLFHQAQYAFIHDALDESITCGETAISVTNIRITLTKLSKQEDTKTGFEEQYEVNFHCVFFYAIPSIMLIHSYLGVLQIKQNQECTPEREPRITMPQKIVARTYYPVSVKNQCHAQHTVTTTIIIIVIDDLTRVYLKSTGARGSDYINANYIDVS